MCLIDHSTQTGTMSLFMSVCVFFYGDHYLFSSMLVSIITIIYLTVASHMSSGVVYLNAQLILWDVHA